MTKNEQALQTTNLDNIGYSGKIQVSIMQGNRMLSSNTYYNNGTQKLFEFFADCLTGNWVDAKANRPCKIILFKQGNGETASFNSEYWTDTHAISTEAFHDTAIPKRSVGDGGFEAVYHFRIPFLLLIGDTTVSKIGLYPKIISSKEEDLLAYFFLEEPISIPAISGNLTLIIDWSLRVSNQLTAKNQGE